MLKFSFALIETSTYFLIKSAINTSVKWQEDYSLGAKIEFQPWLIISFLHTYKKKHWDESHESNFSYTLTCHQSFVL